MSASLCLSDTQILLERPAFSTWAVARQLLDCDSTARCPAVVISKVLQMVTSSNYEQLLSGSQKSEQRREQAWPLQLSVQSCCSGNSTNSGWRDVAWSPEFTTLLQMHGPCSSEGQSSHMHLISSLTYSRTSLQALLPLLSHIISFPSTVLPFSV